METIIKFDPTVEQLNEIVSIAREVVVTDLEDKEQLEKSKGLRLNFVKARTTIEKCGKKLRAEALKFQKDVIAREKELLSIITPEEDRLKQYELDAEFLYIQKERTAQLPERKERVAKAGIEMTDEYIMSLNMVDFECKFNELVSEKNEKDRLENERIKQEQEAETKRIADIALRMEQQKIRDAEIKAQAEKDALDKIEREKAQQALKEKQDAEKLAKDTEYNNFKAQYDFDKEENTGSEIILWKKVATYKLN